MDISTPKILDLSNIAGSNTKSSEGSNYGDFHVKKTVYQRFSTKQPTKVTLGFLPTQLHYAVKFDSNNQQRDTSPQKNREGENKIGHRDIVEILVKNSEGQIISRELKVIGMTYKGQAFVDISLPEGESILQSSFFQTTNNNQGENGKSVIIFGAKNK